MVRIMFAAMLALATTAAARAPKEGELAPKFVLHTIDGRTIRSEELRGKVVVLNFWATWCVPCRRELPILDRYYELQRDHGLEVFAVTTEDSVQRSQLKALFAALHLTPVNRIGGSYDTLNAVPTNYVIDRAGVLRYAKAAAFELDDLNAVLVPLLREPAPAAPPASP